MPMISHGSTNGAPTKPADRPPPPEAEPGQPERRQACPAPGRAGATTKATTNEFAIASRSVGSDSASEYQCRVKPSSGNASTLESLNENSTRITSGPNSASITMARNSRQPHALAARRRRAREAPVDVGDREAVPLPDRLDHYDALTSVQAAIHASRLSGGLAGIALSRVNSESSAASSTTFGGTASMMPWFDVR